MHSHLKKEELKFRRLHEYIQMNNDCNEVKIKGSKTGLVEVEVELVLTFRVQRRKSDREVRKQ